MKPRTRLWLTNGRDVIVYVDAEKVAEELASKGGFLIVKDDGVIQLGINPDHVVYYERIEEA